MPDRLTSSTPASARPVTIDREVLTRYEATYGLEAGDITAEQVRRHLEVEQRLTRELLDSAPEHRWQTFQRCYDELYEQLPWLVSAGGPADSARWTRLIGKPPQRIYEVGSGAGHLARVLASVGHYVEATDVSPRRGGGRPTSARLRWSVTDGVNLGRFATSEPYDVVVSDQVVEHLHPADVLTHSRSCHEILRPGGRYILRTPNALTGPHDVSRVFGFERAVGMHLREYTVTELRVILGEAGFTKVRTVLSLPPSFARPSAALTALQLLAEATLRHVSWKRRQQITRHLRGPLRLDVWVVASRS